VDFSQRKIKLLSGKFSEYSLTTSRACFEQPLLAMTESSLGIRFPRVVVEEASRSGLGGGHFTLLEHQSKLVLLLVRLARG
jgi:hypothetical protein